MKKFGEFICKNRVIVIIISVILLVLSFIGSSFTKINYDILVYLPEDIETIKGQNTLTNDFDMGAYSITIIDNMPAKEIIKLEEDIKNVSGVNEVVSLYDVVGTSVPIEMLPSEIVDKLHQGNSDLLFITFSGGTSSEETIDAVREIKEITDNRVKLGGLSATVLDTMDLSESEITIYIIIAVLLCILVLELSLDSYVVPFILLANIGCAILFNLGTNIFLGEISYITKALVAVLQLGVTTDFSIFLYHSYEKKKAEFKKREDAMVAAIKETFTSVTGSSLTTIAGFLVLCTMKLTLGTDLGIVMAKGVLIGVITVLTLFPSLLLVFDKIISKTKHKEVVPKFNHLNNFIVKHHIAIFIVFLICFIPAYLANSKVDVYYKIDKTLPDTLDSIMANERIKNEFNIVSPEIILINKDIKNDKVKELSNKLENIDGVDFALTYAKIKDLGITEDYLDSDIVKIFENDEYQMILINSTYDVATDELNNQIDEVNKLVKEYDDKAIVAGVGPLMKDLIEVSNQDFKNVNYTSIICIFIILFFVLRSISLPFLLIAAIEFAIFINMGVSYFSGATLPFIAPIVLGTIQLGATIDYAILMTTTYFGKRRKGLEKKQAMLDTLNYSGTSIFISGMCFFAATFGVGIYSDLDMVAVLCNLISRGAIISMLVVIMFLPSILLIFDKLIIKTTLKERKDNMKNIKENVKKLAVWILLIGAVSTCMPINAKALTKDETVYQKLNSDGTVKNIIVNETLINNKKSDTINDYTILKNIINVNNDSTYKIDGNSLVWDAMGSNIFYQGTTDKKLPISLSITYKLNGKNIELVDLLGKSGKVSITLKYTNNDKHIVSINGKKTTLYTPFVVATGTILDSSNFTNVSISNGRIIENGTKTIVAGISSPGLYESLGLDDFKGMDTITISFDVEKFELASIYSVITPKLLDSTDLTMFDKLDEVYTSIDALQENMDIIEAGTNEIAKGSTELKTKLQEAIASLSDTEATNTKVNNALNESLKTTDPTGEQLVTTATTDAIKSYLATNTDYIACETGKYIASQGGTPTSDQLNSCKTVQTILPVLQEAAGLIAKNVSTSLTPYVAKSTATKVLDLTSKEITSSLSALYAGVDALDNGIQDLNSGITAYNKEGINKLSTLVNNDVKPLVKKVKELIKLGENYTSFAGKLNTDKGNTKFIMVVDRVSAPKEEIKTNTQTTKLSLWERIKNLFK